MTTPEIVALRLLNQQITVSDFTSPGKLVGWFGAMQAQDYGQSKWAIGLRIPGFTEADVEKAVADRKIVRTWPLRGTLHWVAASDIHWMMDLQAPKIRNKQSARDKQLGLDPTIYAKANKILANVLRGTQLTRDELTHRLAEGGVDASKERLSHILHRAALEKIVCFSTRRGKEFTFALLDEWIKPGIKFTRDEALASLAVRYFTSHGPATLNDFIWWSGLSITEARKALDFVKSMLNNVCNNDQTYWFASSGFKPVKPEGTFLLAAFDEYLIGYADRSACLDQHNTRITISTNGIFYPIVVINGQVEGIWRRSVKKKQIHLEVQTFKSLKDIHKHAILSEAGRYSQFMGSNDPDVTFSL